MRRSVPISMSAGPVPWTDDGQVSVLVELYQAGDFESLLPANDPHSPFAWVPHQQDAGIGVEVIVIDGER